MHLREQIGDFFLVLVNHRRNDVRWWLVIVNLENILAKICLYRRHSGGFQCPIELHLFRDHGLGLDDFFDFMFLGNFDHQFRRLLGGLCVEHGGATPRGFLFKNIEPHIQVLDRAHAALDRCIARSLEVVQLGDSGHARTNKLGREFFHCLLQALIRELLTCARLEMHALNLHHASPERICATCSTRVL